MKLVFCFTQERTEIIEKAVDCLRIVTTGSDANKRALVEITIAVPTLVNLLSDDPSQARPRPYCSPNTLGCNTLRDSCDIN